MKYLPLFHHFKAIYQFPKHIIFGVKIVFKWFSKTSEIIDEVVLTYSFIFKYLKMSGFWTVFVILGHSFKYARIRQAVLYSLHLKDIHIWNIFFFYFYFFFYLDRSLSKDKFNTRVYKQGDDFSFEWKLICAGYLLLV